MIPEDAAKRFAVDTEGSGVHGRYKAVTNYPKGRETVKGERRRGGWELKKKRSSIRRS